MEIPLLQDVAIIFGLSIIVLFIFEKIRLPPIIGFLLTGTLVGSHGLHLIESMHEVEMLAEIGVVLLLFTIGLELSIRELVHNKKAVLLGGSLQVFLTVLIVFGLSRSFGITPGTAIFMGCLVSLSSTAIVLGVLQEKGKVHSSHGKMMVAILIFQDIISVVMMLLTPLLQQGDQQVDITNALLILLVKAVVIIGLVIVSSRYIIPRLMYQIANTKNQDLFLLSIVGVCLLIAWGAASVGLSLGLGAFLAGLIISESEYSLRALGSVLPFRSVFLSFFFVSIGILFNVMFLFENLLLILMLTLCVIGIKALVLLLVGIVLRSDLKTTLLVGLSLSQIGEFSFLLSTIGLDSGVLSQHHYQLFLSIAVLTMGLTPLLMYLAPLLAGSLLKAQTAVRFRKGPAKVKSPTLDRVDQKMEYHLVIIGYGLHGKLLAKTARETAIPYIILEMDAEIVKEERLRGEPILYGDARHENFLNHAYIKNAFMVVIATSDITTSRQIVSIVRQLNPKVHILVRTRFILEVDHLTRLGANSVIPVEFEAALAIQRQTLSHFMIPPDEIERFMDRIRQDGYRKFIADAVSGNFEQAEIDKMFSHPVR
ncbi:MAG: cation:proton antiporter [SAR324 cluster bacterium]|nr:cation:proton antiporter [SAR324 cluster bacterium]